MGNYLSLYEADFVIFTIHPFAPSPYTNNSQRRLPCILNELNATAGDVASKKDLIFRVERIQVLDATPHGRLFAAVVVLIDQQPSFTACLPIIQTIRLHRFACW